MSKSGEAADMTEVYKNRKAEVKTVMNKYEWSR
jgi:hypothetical protein